jgi:hypothetical protein
MTRAKFLVLAIATVAASSTATYVAIEASADEARPAGGIVQRFRSELLGEERELSIHLPEGYTEETGRRYPVLYVLDGGTQAANSAESAALLARAGVIEPLVVVGVASLDGEKRSRDYTPPDQPTDADDAASPRGAADRFLAHLEDELIPRVEAEVRTTRPRLLAGWSRGGLFVVWSLLEAPALFDGHLAFGPALWREEERVVGQFERALADGSLPPAALYLSLGDGENDEMAAAYRRLVEALEAGAPPNLRWRADRTRGATHATNPKLSTPVGLRFLLAAEPPCAEAAGAGAR